MIKSKIRDENIFPIIDSLLLSSPPQHYRHVGPTWPSLVFSFPPSPRRKVTPQTSSKRMRRTSRTSHPQEKRVSRIFVTIDIVGAGDCAGFFSGLSSRLLIFSLTTMTYEKRIFVCTADLQTTIFPKSKSNRYNSRSENMNNDIFLGQGSTTGRQKTGPSVYFTYNFN